MSRLVRYLHDGHEHRGTVVGGRIQPGSAGAVVTSLPLDAVRLLSPVDPGTVFGMARNSGPADAAQPPLAFLKARASVTGTGWPVVVPDGCDTVTAEAELAVVVGRTARRVSPDEALDVVAGYTVGLDVTAADLKESDPRWTEAKSRETFTPLGPWLVSDLDPRDLAIELRVDGELVATGRTSGLGRGVAECLSYLSGLVTLQPGDVVLTGAPGTFALVAPGATVSASVEGIGTLVNPVVGEEVPCLTSTW